MAEKFNVFYVQTRSGSEREELNAMKILMNEYSLLGLGTISEASDIIDKRYSDVPTGIIKFTISAEIVREFE